MIREDLKVKFVTGYKIPQADYITWLDAMYFKTDSVTANYIEPLNTNLDVNNHYVTNVSKLSFTISGDGVMQEGDMSWDTINHCPQYQTQFADVKIQLGQEDVVPVLNSNLYQINDGQVVYIVGAGQGTDRDKPTIDLALASFERKSYTLGVATHNIGANSGEGLVTTRGFVNDFDCRTDSEGHSLPVSGAMVYLSTTVTGGWTIIEPTAPNHSILLGRALNNKNAGAGGTLYVSVNIGHELDELHDVLITTPTSGDLLRYDGTVWRNVRGASGNFMSQEGKTVTVLNGLITGIV